MGTRADFYVGRGENAEWLGSVAMDGYAVAEIKPEHADKSDENRSIWAVKTATDEQSFRDAVKAYLGFQSHSTLPEQGWPWPWEDSRTTDYSYAFDGKTYASCFGYKWFDPNVEREGDDDETKEVFPNMKERQNVTFGQRSGLFIVQVKS